MSDVDTRTANNLEQLEAENKRLYALLAAAHLNLRQHLKYGFDPRSTRSTLISVGQYYPQLKAEMDKQEALDKMADNARELGLSYEQEKNT